MTPRSVMDIMFAALSRAMACAVGAKEQESTPPAACVACGSRIRSDWRLCPHCGALRDGQVSAR